MTNEIGNNEMSTDYLECECITTENWVLCHACQIELDEWVYNNPLHIRNTPEWKAARELELQNEAKRMRERRERMEINK